MGILGDWQRGPVIGRGASATVSIATDRVTGDVLAVKSVGIALAGVLLREQSVLSALSSPYVVSCVGSGVSAASDGSGYELFLELAPGGSLADEIRRCGGRCEEPLIRSRVGDVLRGLAHVHGSGIAHCDVKARNVLVGADGRAKLADFGCARRTVEAEDLGNSNAAAISGTPMFLSPEAARGEAQGTAADIWAVGCTVIEMATGGAPWPGLSSPAAALHHVARSEDVPEAPAWLSGEGKDFLARCLVRDPAQRWTAEQLLQHPFVASTETNPTSNSNSKAAPIERWVSPKSVLDQGFWFWEEDSSSTTVPADRVRALASAESPDWTWSGEEWIAVCCTTTTDSNDTAPEKLDAETTEAAGGSNADDEHVPSSSRSDGAGVGGSSSNVTHGGSRSGDDGSSWSWLLAGSDFSVGEGTGYASFTSQASFSLPRNTPASMEKIDKKDVEVRVSESVKEVPVDLIGDGPRTERTG
ncbi:mitogen-activated protein kinase kinase kinase 18-like [Lolium rigidum]|uniref:mitogen-activated protein kinase kinase kinase 18-like n=1 Tax=Lolium rigidum TaxID=89674 RepID=UPI001F5D8222|nr:mitogen-activated protein kinase kinase kinase 18-like [Lolium rigidum]